MRPPAVTSRSCMACSRAAWVLGGVRLISSARITLAKMGPWMKRNCAVAGAVVLFEDLGAGDVAGHQVGRELDAVEAQVQDLGQAADEQGLGQAGHALQQDVAAGEQGDHHFLEDSFLPHDDLADLRAHGLVVFQQLIDPGGVVHIRAFRWDVCAKFQWSQNKVGSRYYPVFRKNCHGMDRGLFRRSLCQQGGPFFSLMQLPMTAPAQNDEIDRIVAAALGHGHPVMDFEEGGCATSRRGKCTVRCAGSARAE